MRHHLSNHVVVSRFWSKVDRASSCWLWTAGADEDGYGKFVPAHHEQVRAHRFSWMLRFGPIPDGLMVLHNCPDGDNPRCVNPAHLWLGTNADNQKDRLAKGRSSYGERQGAHKLTADAVAQIRAECAGGATKISLARKHGVSPSNIRRIVAGETWRHLLTAGDKSSSASTR